MKKSIISTGLVFLLILAPLYSPGSNMISAYASITPLTASHPCTYPLMVNGVIDPSQHHTLYSPDSTGAVLKDGIPISLVESDQSYSEQVAHITCPYPSLPDTWKWLVFQITNRNTWPVKAFVDVRQLNNGARFTGDETFGANETKYLRLVLNNATVGQDAAIEFLVHTYIEENRDPVAPTAPPSTVDYVYNPPADDGTGHADTMGDFQGLSFTPNPNAPYHSSLKFWALQPSVKQVPTWVPNPGEDPHWGQIQYANVSGYEWVQTGEIKPVNENSTFYTDASIPGMPYINQGSYGAFQTTRPSGRSVTAWQWSKANWAYSSSNNSGTYTYPSGSLSTPMETWVSEANNRWPGLVDLTGNLRSNIYSNQGCFYTDSSRSQIVMWSWAQNNTYVSWYVLTPSSQTISGVDYVDLTSISDDNDYDYSNHKITLCAATSGYVSVNGSYDEILSFTRSGTNISASTARQHLFVTNPGVAPVTFSLSQALEVHFAGTNSNGDPTFKTFPVPADSQGTVTIQPGQTAELTSDYSLPQATNYADAPLSFLKSGTVRVPQSDFAVGAIRPIGAGADQRHYAWTTNGIQSNVVGYDWGVWIRNGTQYNISNSPGFYGNVLDYELAMTAQELNSFDASLPSALRSKINNVVQNGYATWGAQKSFAYISKYGYADYAVLVP